MIERGVALQILGLPDDADEMEIGSAYRALRTHVERRLEQSTSDALREARRIELCDLERVVHLLSTVSVSGGTALRPRVGLPRGEGSRDGSSARGPRVARWILSWAVVATLVAAGLLASFFGIPPSFGPAVLFGASGAEGGGEGAGGTGGFAVDGGPGGAADDAAGGATEREGDVKSAGPRAQLVAKSSVAGARLRVVSQDPDSGAAEVVAEGASDDTVYWLSPGDYALTVAHPDCPDGWERRLAVAAGEIHEFTPEVCRSTGWVVVHSDQPGDRVAIDGRKVGQSTEAPHALPAGEHEVRVEKDGYETWEGVVAVAPGQVLGLRPILAAAKEQRPRKPKPTSSVASASPQPENPANLRELDAWHEEAKRWLLARFDDDRSGKLDAQSELEKVPCDQWKSLEESHDASGLGLSLMQFYGFDGDRWKEDSLGVDTSVRDIAYKRMKECGLR